MNKPNLTLIANWITALRSGKYKQTQAFLGRHEEEHESFCCLGVACEIAGIKRQLTDTLIIYDDQDSLAPKQASDLYGFDLNGTGFYFPALDQTRELYIANDNGNQTFAQIARALELHFNLSPYRN